MSSSEEHMNKYRWYLCLHKHGDPFNWHCQPLPTYNANDPSCVDLYHGSRSYTQLVPVTKALPEIMDTVVVRRTLKSNFHVKMEK